MATIKIESILGGHQRLSHFGSKDQFRASLGIDPAQPVDDADSTTSTIGSGLLRPAASQKYSGTTIASAPLWQVSNPKDGLTYIYDANGSAYTVDATFATVTALGDGGSLSSSLGNGCEYYDNYIYFAKNTDIARYGPLNGSPAFNATYWTSTLSMTALANTTYPASFKNGILYPNHVMHRHSDGILYVADVVSNKGAIHTISTSFASVEGDTNNSSTYYKLTLGFGIYPTALESLGSDLAIGAIEFSNTGKRDPRAKIAFWDTTSAAFNRITWVEFPDQIITALKNVNGVLYVVSGNFNSRGFRVSRFIGGYTFETVWYSETGEPPFAGAVDAIANQLLIGSHTNVPESDGCVYSLGLQNGIADGRMFNIMRATGGDSSTNVTCLSVADNVEMGFFVPQIGWTKGTGTSNNGLDKQGTQYNNAPSVWWSPVYRIGQPFYVQKITIPLANAIGAGTTIIPKIYVDDGSTTTTLTTINNTNFANSERHITYDLSNVYGENNFWLELRWTGSGITTVGLPVVIEFEKDGIGSESD